MASPVVFNHIPKTAGTALTRALRTALGAERVRGGMDRFVLGAHDDLSTFSRHARRMIATGPEEIPADADLVAGHFTPTTTRQSHPDAHDLTVLREPRTRLLSSWLFMRAHTDRDLRPWGQYGDLIRLSHQPLIDYLADPRAAAHTDNGMLRFLTWPHPAAAPDAFIEPADEDELLAAAFGVLAGFSHCDVIESARFLEDLGTWLGTDVELEATNEMPSIPQPLRPDLEAELSGRAGDLLTARSRLDRTLWASVLRVSDTVLDVTATADDTFTRTVERYADRLAQPAAPRQPLPTRLRRKVRHRLQLRRITHG